MFYLDLFEALARYDVDYVVIGGLALNLHGVERATMDISLVIALDRPNLGAAIDAFGALELVPVVPVDLDAARDPETLRRWRRAPSCRRLARQWIHTRREAEGGSSRRVAVCG